MEKKYLFKISLLLIIILLISILCSILFYNHKEKNGNISRLNSIKEENDNTNPVLPTVSPDLENQINEIFKDKDSVKPRLETVNPYYGTLEYEIKTTIGCGVDELEFTDIPVEKPFVFEGLECTITDYSIVTGKEFMDKFFDEEDKSIPESELSEDYDFTKDGTYAVVYCSFKKVLDEATYIQIEMLFTDMKLCGLYDRDLTDIAKEYLGKKGRRRLMDIPVGEQVDTVWVLNLNNPSDSKEFYILIPKVSGEVEKRLWVEGKMTQEEVMEKHNENKNKFYRIKLIEE